MVPVAMSTMAVAVGNAMILKPSEKVPLFALRLSELWTEAGLPEGAVLAADGRHPQVTHEEGFYLGATLLDHAKPNMKIHKEEVFRPARNVVRVKTLEEAIDLINDHEFVMV